MSYVPVVLIILLGQECQPERQKNCNNNNNNNNVFLCAVRNAFKCVYVRKCPTFLSIYLFCKFCFTLV